MIVRCIKNLTPHRVTIYDTCGVRVKAIYESVGVARVISEGKPAGIVYGIPVRRISGTVVEGLPDKEEGTVYIVSSYVAATLKDERDDLVSPDSSTAVFNVNKEVIGVRRFVTYSDCNFEISNVASFLSVYKKTNICRNIKLQELNSLYVYYKQIVEAGGEWPGIEEVNEWSKITVDELGIALRDKEKITTDMSICQQNEIIISYLYSHAEVVLESGRVFIAKALRV